MDYKLSDEDLQWVEEFYAEWERGSGFKRPDNYIERAYKVLTGQRNTVRQQSEGKTGYFRED